MWVKVNHHPSISDATSPSKTFRDNSPVLCSGRGRIYPPQYLFGSFAFGEICLNQKQVHYSLSHTDQKNQVHHDPRASHVTNSPPNFGHPQINQEIHNSQHQIFMTTSENPFAIANLTNFPSAWQKCALWKAQSFALGYELVIKVTLSIKICEEC